MLFWSFSTFVHIFICFTLFVFSVCCIDNFFVSFIKPLKLSFVLQVEGKCFYGRAPLVLVIKYSQKNDDLFQTIKFLYTTPRPDTPSKDTKMWILVKGNYNYTFCTFRSAWSTFILRCLSLGHFVQDTHKYLQKTSDYIRPEISVCLIRLVKLRYKAFSKQRLFSLPFWSPACMGKLTKPIRQSAVIVFKWNSLTSSFAYKKKTQKVVLLRRRSCIRS